MAMTAAPTPISGRAPVLSRWDDVEKGFAVSAEGPVDEVDLAMEEDGAGNVADEEGGKETETETDVEDILDNVDVDGDAWPTVATSANRLEVTLQKLSSPQHQLLSGAFSPCHWTFLA
jgi:hypothetical protein